MKCVEVEYIWYTTPNRAVQLISDGLQPNLPGENSPTKPGCECSHSKRHLMETRLGFTLIPCRATTTHSNLPHKSGADFTAYYDEDDLLRHSATSVPCPL